VPLAFDNIAYQSEDCEDSNYEFDVAYVGGWANNGFDTKKKIMMEHFAAFKDSGLKCGFFINKNLTHEQELKILANSKICINVHDDYQRIMKLDTNERTWKALGLNGILISDNVGSVIPDQPNIYQVESPEEMVKTAQWVINGMEGFNRNTTKEFVLEYETYVERCKQLESI